jgi:hypothetical protein
MGITTKSFDKSNQKPIVYKPENKARLFMSRAEAQAENEKRKNIADKVEAFRRTLEQGEKDGLRDEVKAEDKGQEKQKEDVLETPVATPVDSENPIVKRRGRPKKAE